MSKFKTGDRVRVNKSDATSHGEVGTITGFSGWGDSVYSVNFDNELVTCPNWSERYLEHAFEIDSLVEVVGYPDYWNGAKGWVTQVGDHGVYIRLAQPHEEHLVGTELYFPQEYLVPTTIPFAQLLVKETTKQELALTVAYHTFKFYQSQHEAKGKGQKARANELLADMMKEALDDLE